ncbi:MAG: 50S ribosomal protein L11 methyltransferase [Acidobacteriaceae bacterium]|nr:50S ribosomal protein L11 methyltransferase [Acidobacteriaceae bacterium]
MPSILIQSETNTREALITELWEHGTTGIIENSGTVQAFFESDSQLAQIASQLSYPVLEVNAEDDLARTLDLPSHRDPIYAGQRFFIVSSRINDPTPPGRTRLVIDAADAFGSGSHESTQLVIQALEDHLPANSIVLDVGCGSGILSAVAQELGASQVFACDTHLGVFHSARKHSPNSYFFAGSIDALTPSIADVIMINIGASVIDLLTDELYRVAKPGSLLILAGFTSDRIPARIHPEQVLQLNDWLCWLCHPQNIDRNQHPPLRTLQPFPAQWW